MKKGSDFAINSLLVVGLLVGAITWIPWAMAGLLLFMSLWFLYALVSAFRTGLSHEDLGADDTGIDWEKYGYDRHGDMGVSGSELETDFNIDLEHRGMGARQGGTQGGHISSLL